MSDTFIKKKKNNKKIITKKKHIALGGNGTSTSEIIVISKNCSFRDYRHQTSKSYLFIILM